MRARKGSKLDGLLLLDKPLGVTSNGILQRVRKLFGAQKAGHTGSLDPLASGVLPICFGEATKFSSFGLEADKAYLATGTLGVRTETGDAEGNVVAEAAVPEELDEASLNRVIQLFTGTVHQVPSMYSALKYQGRPLYEYARKGVDVPREGRDIQIHELKLLRFGSETFDIYVRCSKGTYIRTLVEDIGEKLGCGAHVSALRRVQSGPYLIDSCKTIEELEVLIGEVDPSEFKSHLLGVDALVEHLPLISLGNADSGSILQGQTVRMSASASPGTYRLYSDTKEFLGIGTLDECGDIRPKRLISSPIN